MLHENENNTTNNTNNNNGATICAACGAVITGDVYEIDGRFYCDDCIAICHDCGNVILKADAEIIGGETFCESCAEDVRVCYDCGQFIHIGDDALCGADGEWYCEDCFYDNFDFCESCGEPVYNDDVIIAHSSAYSRHDVPTCYCPDCARRHAWQCDICGDWYIDDAFSIETEDGTVCENCADDYYYCNICDRYVANGNYDFDAEMCCDCARDNARLITGYHDRPALHFFGESQKRWHGLWRGIGAELEIDRDDADTDAETETAESIKNIAGDAVYFNRDGSLHNGFEIITQPHTEAAFRAFPWEDVLAACRAGGYSSHDIGTCGLHLHFSRAFFGSSRRKQDIAVSKLIRFYDLRWDDILKISRRTAEQADRWAARYCTDSRAEAEDYGHGKKYAGRYHAINTTNAATIELRLTRGTLNASTFRACVDFMITICKNARRIKWSDVGNVSEWLRGCAPATLEYIRARGAFSEEV